MVRTNLSGLSYGAHAYRGHHGCPRAAGLLTEQASGRASQINRFQLRRATLSFSAFRLAYLGGFFFLEVM